MFLRGLNLAIILLVVSWSQADEITQWLNKGSQYAYCQDAEKYSDICSSYDGSSEQSSGMLGNRQFTVDCQQMLNKIACSIRRLNCPGIKPGSFMMYDPPCQSSCLAVAKICHQSPLSLFDPEKKRDSLQLAEYNFWTEPSANGRGFDDELESEFDDGWSGISRTPRQYDSNSYMPARRRLMKRQAQQDELYWRQGFSPPYRYYNTREKSQRRRRANGNSNNNQFMVLSHDDNNAANWVAQNREMWQACGFLPTGGCSDWVQNITKTHPLDSNDLAVAQKTNSGCPDDLMEKCSLLFPMRMPYNDLIKGNFTVAAYIEVVQTLWSFDSNGDFRPMFRFTIQDTIKSDIQTPDRNKILSQAWPVKCFCQGQMTVGSRYLMLTHSKANRHRLLITDKSVFISDARTRLLARTKCMLEGNCQNLRRRRFSVYSQ